MCAASRSAARSEQRRRASGRRRAIRCATGHGGLLLGLVAGIWLRRLVATFVFGVTAGNPATYAVASIAFLTIALAAIAIPALRAARVEPTTALRDE